MICIVNFRECFLDTMSFKLIVFVWSCLVFSTTSIHVARGTISNLTSRNPTSSVSQIRLTQTERNRRLVPYTMYYVSRTPEDAGNAVQQFDHENVEGEQSAYYNTPKSKPDISISGYTPQKNDYDYLDGQQQTPVDPLNAYSYIPVAYIPAARPISYNSNPHYYHATYFHDPRSVDVVNTFTTASPKATTATTTTTTTTRSHAKGHVSILDDYVPQNGFLKFTAQPFRLQNVEKKTTSFPVRFRTPQADYLHFRYSELLRTSTPTYETSTISPTPNIEITSPKYYLAPNGAFSTPTPQKMVTTAIYSSTYEYPEESHLTYSVPKIRRIPLPIPKVVPLKPPEQSYQSTQTMFKPQQVKAPIYRVNNLPRSHDFKSDLTDFNVDNIFKDYNINKQLPDRITPDNIKESIRTLSYLLQMLQKADSKGHFHKEPNLYSKDTLDGNKDRQSLIANDDRKTTSSLQNVDSPYDTYEQLNPPLLNDENPIKDEQSTPGRAAIDYPIYSFIPETSFLCKTQRYKGFFADPETKCQVWHYCDLNGGQASFLCPNGTIFNQAALTCDWWFNVKCSATPQLYVLNERLYKYIIPARPSFPEDFSGPLVDQYLTEKFKETESNRKHKYPSSNDTSPIIETSPSSLNLTALNEYDIPTHLLNENL